MLNIPRKSFAQIVIIGGIVISAHPAWGASIGAHGHQANPQLQAEDSSLPALHERVPTNVPTLSNQALVKLWEHNQFSPILRNSTIEIQLSSAVTAQRDLNPTRFDHLPPVVGHLISDPAYFNKLLAAYIAHPARFTLYHHQLVPLIRGIAMTPPTSTSPPPGDSGVGGTSVGDNNSPPPTGAQELTVPGPPSLVLLAFGMSYMASRIRGRRSRPSPETDLARET
jgi:hypothetical protein